MHSVRGQCVFVNLYAPSIDPCVVAPCALTALSMFPFINIIFAESKHKKLEDETTSMKRQHAAALAGRDDQIASLTRSAFAVQRTLRIYPLLLGLN